MIKKSHPVSMADYERIFRVIHSVSNSIGNIPGSSCIFYNVVGAAILELNFQKRAQPVMGSAFIRVHDPSDTIISYSHLENEIPYSDSNAFHCWVQCEGYAVDFTSPVYFESIGCLHQIARKMFQKNLALMSKSHMELTKEGDFFLQPNIDLTNELIGNFSKSAAASDLANVCLNWFKKMPDTIAPVLTMVDNFGEVTEIKLSSHQLIGEW